MAASIAQPNQNMFLTAVDQVLKSWPALHLAVEQGFGGPDSREKADWMATAIDTWFQENEGLHADEVEDFLNDVLNDEFDLRVEDGSIVEVSRQICFFYQLCRENNVSEIQTRLQALPKPKVNAVKQDMDDEGEMESDEDAMPSSSSTHQNTSMSSSSTNYNQPSASGTTEEMEADEEEDDGWKVMRGKGRRKK